MSKKKILEAMDILQDLETDMAKTNHLLKMADSRTILLWFACINKACSKLNDIVNPTKPL
jgi:hypothetical protein